MAVSPINLKQISQIHSPYFISPPTGITPLGSGEFSTAYLLNFSDQSDLVLKSSSSSIQFAKEAYASKHFRSPNVIIPGILEVGQLPDGTNYCLSEKCPGSLVDSLPDLQFLAIIPIFISTSFSLWSTPLPANTAGFWDENGDTKFTSWNEFLIQTSEQIINTNSSYPSISLFHQLYKIMLKNLPFTVSDTFLVHGDYGFNNIFSDHNRITGIIDWGDSLYGDFAYDIATLQFWSQETNHVENFLQASTASTLPFHNYLQRLTCYTAYIGIRVLHHFQSRNDDQSFTWVANKLSQSPFIANCGEKFK